MLAVSPSTSLRLKRFPTSVISRAVDPDEPLSPSLAEPTPPGILSRLLFGWPSVTPPNIPRATPLRAVPQVGRDSVVVRAVAALACAVVAFVLAVLACRPHRSGNGQKHIRRQLPVEPVLPFSQSQKLFHAVFQAVGHHAHRLRRGQGPHPGSPWILSTIDWGVWFRTQASSFHRRRSPRSAVAEVVMIQNWRLS